MLAGRERLDWFGEIVRPSGLRPETVYEISELLTLMSTPLMLRVEYHFLS
jgi:hypothetical protein